MDEQLNNMWRTRVYVNPPPAEPVWLDNIEGGDFWRSARVGYVWGCICGLSVSAAWLLVRWVWG